MFKRLSGLNWTVIALMSINALISAFVMQTYHLDYWTLNHGDRIMVWVLSLQAWTNILVSLLLSVGKRAAKGEDMFSDDDSLPLPDITKTVVGKKTTQITQQTTAVEEAKPSTIVSSASVEKEKEKV